MNRKERRTARKESESEVTSFLKTADKFIDLANRENDTVKATRLHMAFLYASARYSAFVAKTILDVQDHEEFVKMLTNEYRDYLRQNLADDGLAGPG